MIAESRFISILVVISTVARDVGETYARRRRDVRLIPDFGVRKMKFSKYLPSDAKWRPGNPSMGSGYPTLGVGYMGPAGRRERVGEQSKIFDIFERERIRYRARERERYRISKTRSAFYDIQRAV